jgi:DNA-binding winged helix-turn-helix (wHTH) protein
MDLDERSRSSPINLATHPPVTLGELRLDPPARTLHGSASAVTLEPRVMQLLLALSRAKGAVVSREALLDACWGSLVVGDDALNRAVAGARRGLRQAGASAWAVETIARVGYRLVDGSAQSGPAEAPASAPPSVSEPSAAPGTGADAAHTVVAATPQPARRGWLVVGASGAAALMFAGAWVMRRNEARQAELRAAVDQAQRLLRLATPSATQRATAVLEDLLKQDDGDAATWGLLALARRAAAEAVPPDALQAALAAVGQAAGRALALDPVQPDALTAQATLLPSFGRWGETDAALRAVLERHPAHLPTLDALAMLWASTGILAPHYPLRLKTVTGDPLHAGYNFRSIYSHWMNGQLPTADQAGERGLELWPQHVPTWIARSDLLAYTGRAERSLLMLASAPPVLPPPAREHMRRTWTALAGGSAADRAAARGSALAGLEHGGPLQAVGATMDLAALGEVELALDVAEAFLLERGNMRAGTAWRPGQPWHVDVRRRFTNHLFLPVTAPLRQHPRFAALMRDIGLAEHWRRGGRAPDYLLTQ